MRKLKVGDSVIDTETGHEWEIMWEATRIPTRPIWCVRLLEFGSELPEDYPTRFMDYLPERQLQLSPRQILKDKMNKLFS